MTTPFTIVFKNVATSLAVETIARARFDKLARYHPHIIGGRLVVGLSDRHRQRGHRFNVLLSVSVPGQDIVVDSGPAGVAPTRTKQTVRHKSDEVDGDLTEASVVVRRAFDAARRQLQDRARRVRGDVKRRQPGIRGPLKGGRS